MKKIIITTIAILTISANSLTAKQTAPTIVLDLNKDIIKAVNKVTDDIIQDKQKAAEMRETFESQQNQIKIILSQKVIELGESYQKYKALKYANLFIRFQELLNAEKTISLNDSEKIYLVLNNLADSLNDLPKDEKYKWVRIIASTMYFFEKDGKYLNLYNFLSAKFENAQIYDFYPYTDIANDNVIYIPAK